MVRECHCIAVFDVCKRMGEEKGVCGTCLHGSVPWKCEKHGQVNEDEEVGDGEHEEDLVL